MISCNMLDTFPILLPCSTGQQQCNTPQGPVPYQFEGLLAQIGAGAILLSCVLHLASCCMRPCFFVLGSCSDKMHAAAEHGHTLDLLAQSPTLLLGRHLLNMEVLA